MKVILIFLLTLPSPAHIIALSINERKTNHDNIDIYQRKHFLAGLAVVDCIRPERIQSGKQFVSVWSSKVSFSGVCMVKSMTGSGIARNGKPSMSVCRFFVA